MTITSRLASLKASASGKDLFLIIDGRKIAKRGKPKTKHAGKWIPLEPGYKVFDDDGEIIVIHDKEVSN